MVSFLAPIKGNNIAVFNRNLWNESGKMDGKKARATRFLS